MLNNSYTIIDSKDETYAIVPATNANIRRICEVCTQATFKTDDERLFYAQEGDLSPDEIDPAGNPVYTFRNLYTQGPFYAALAQQLFFDFPEIVKEKDGTIKIVDKELYELINRGEVKRALSDFMGEFVATPYEVRNLLNSLESGQIQQILQKVKEALPETQEPIGMQNINGEETS